MTETTNNRVTSNFFLSRLRKKIVKFVLDRTDIPSIDRLVAVSAIRLNVLVTAILGRKAPPDKWILSIIYGVSGLVAEPFYWLQLIIYYLFHHTTADNKNRSGTINTAMKPDEIVFILGHWRSGTTYLHYELTSSKFTNVFTMRNSYTIAPQAALLLKPLINRIQLKKQRPIDWVEWDIHAPQEIDIGLQRFTSELPHIAICQGLDPGPALVKWANCIPSPHFERHYQLLMDWGWIHDTMSTYNFIFGDRSTTKNQEKKKIYIIKTPIMTAHVDILVRLYPKAKFVYIERDAKEVISSFGIILKVYNEIFGCWRREYLHDYDDEKDAAAMSVQALKEGYLRHKHLIPNDQLCEIKYEDLLKDPNQTVSNIQKKLNFQFHSSSLQ